MEGKLYLIPNVIAEKELDTIPSSVKDVIKSTTYYLAENVRTARRYISALKLGLSIEDLQFEILDKKTSTNQIEHLMQPILKGRDIGILSESGCPGVADPGAKAVEWAQKKGVIVQPLVGPSSIIMALMGSGFSGQNFCFHGYLPIDKKALVKQLHQLELESRQRNQTQIFIETPYRNNQLLKTIMSVNSKNTKLCIAKNLTGPDEIIVTKTLSEWSRGPIDLHKIPAVFLLYAGAL